jgi:hypothetical protein
MKFSELVSFATVLASADCCNTSGLQDCMLAAKKEQNTTLPPLLLLPVCHLLLCVT